MNTKNLLYISTTNAFNPANGLSKKVNSQVKAFEQHGFKVYQTSFDDDKEISIIHNDNLMDKQSFSNNYKKVPITLLLFFNMSILLKRFLSSNDESYYIYIRKSSWLEPIIAYFLKSIFKNRLIIYMEIPTYPYMFEITNRSKPLIGISKRLIDILTRALCYKSIHKVVTLSEHKKICRRNTINITNGYDTNIQLIEKRKISNKTVFTIVGEFNYWHGLDRILNSFALYKNNDVILNIVGGIACPEYEKVKKIIYQNNSLKGIVKIHGRLSGEQLNKVYRETDIAISSMCAFKKGIFLSAALKDREYLSRGLPIVYCTRDLIFKKNLPFIYKVSEDSRPFDVEQIIKWYKKSSFSSTDIFNYFKSNLSWNKVLQPIILDMIELKNF